MFAWFLCNEDREILPRSMRGIGCSFIRNTRPWKVILAQLCLLTCCSIVASGQYYGMQFKGHEFPLDQRSGLDLSTKGPIPLKGDLDLEFYLRFDPGHDSYYGYIFRLLIGEKNIDLVHGIVRNNPNNFELIIVNNTSRIAFPFPIDSLTSDWLHLKFHLDFDSSRITSFVQGRELTDALEGFNPKSGFRLMFGAQSTGQLPSTDVPAMVIRDVQVTVDDKLTYHWPLDETSGSVAHSIPEGKNGLAVNPDWLLKHHNSWKSLFELEMGSMVKTAYDSKHESLFIVSEDTVYLYHAMNDSMQMIAHSAPLHFGKTSDIIFDTLSNRLLLYSIDNNYVATLNSETGEWSEFDPGSEPLTSYWQHNRFIAPDGSLMVIGGYGYHTYKNSVLRWNPERNKFDSIPYGGRFNPRYLAGLGLNPVDEKLYLIGGFGSESGKQSESPDYYYELLSYSLENNTFSRVLEFNEIDRGFCFANSVVFDQHNNLYGFYFPKYEFNNTLQLVRIPLTNPEIVEVGNPIDFKFLDVNSFADLFYSRSQDALIGVYTFSTDVGTSVSVHSIAFPPQVFAVDAEMNDSVNSRALYYFLFGVGVLIFILVFQSRRKYLKAGSSYNKPERSPEPSRHRKKNSILLFGGFQVFDKNGNDITGQFTPLPKKLFLYILLHSLRNGKGVSSNSLYETFWFDKSVESARNNRAVNIVKLKSLLENLESTSISKNTGYWKFDFDPSRTYIDYFEYIQIVQQNTELKREDMVALLSIVEKSPFLNNTNAEWLDSFKSDISNEIIDTFLKYISQSSDDPEFLLHLTNCIFVFDMASEEALKVQCKLLIKQGKHSLAKSAYNKFIKEYKQLYDEDYELSFSQVIGEQT